MFSKGERSHERIFQRYNKSAKILFVAIMLLTFIATLYRFYLAREDYTNGKRQELASYGHQLNNKLSQAKSTLLGMRNLAEYYLIYSDELPDKPPSLQQDGEHFYLEKWREDLTSTSAVMTGNITGIGNIESFNKSFQKELIMANTLTPALVTAHKSIKEANWLYYISKNKFINLYPWVPRSIWQYNDKHLANSLMMQVDLLNDHNKVFWSRPYADSTGKGLYTALGMGVYFNDEMLGALFIDINSAGLFEHLPEVHDEKHGYIIIDVNNQVLIHKNNSNLELSAHTLFRDIAPEQLTKFNYKSLLSLQPISYIGDMVLQKQMLPINGWLLLEYQKSSHFYKDVNKKYIVIFCALLLGLLSLIVAIYYMIKKAFITPSKKFMQHIENCSAGDPGKIKPTAQWQYWFNIVEDLFGENRSLLQRLRDQNNELDLRVKEKTQALLYKSEQQQRDYALLRSVMNAIPDYILFDDQQGRLIGCNQAVEQLLLQKEVDILGHQTKKIIVNKLGETVANSVYAEDYNISEDAEQWTVSTANSTYEIYKAPFYSDENLASGESLILGNIIVIRDVSLQFEINNALKRAKNQAEEANKIKSQFLANMSHEIRTPINAIQGMCFLLQQSQLNKVQDQYLDNAQTASNSLLFLVDELLDSAKVESGNMSIHLAMSDLETIVSQAIKLNISSIIGKNLRFNVAIDSQVPLKLYTDAMRLVQVLSNLLNNAIKFTERGQIDLSVSVSVNKQGKAGASQPVILFKVKDTGIGIDKSKQKSLFEAFKQADESMTRMYGGTGLGLSICQHIAHLLNGDINIESSLGHGAEFTLSLPLNQAQSNESKMLHNEIQTLTKAFKGYSFVNLAVEIPISLQQNFSDISQHIVSINHINELASLNNQDQNILLLGNSKYQQGLTTSELDIISKNTVLLALCQPIASLISNQFIEQLNAYNIEFILLEIPLYRQVIVKISQEVRDIELKLKQPLALDSLPENKQQVIVTELQDKEVSEHSLSGMKVLLVEDNIVNQLVAIKLLESIHVKVIVANNGQEALEILAHDTEPHEVRETDTIARDQIDIVLMDIQMPVMDGLTATRRIRAQSTFKYLPIIAMTAHAREEDKEQCLAAGMNLHLTKPFTLQALRDSISSLMKQ